MKMTKEELAERLNGWIYGDNFFTVASRFEKEAAESNLVFIVGTCNDGCVFGGAISDCVERGDGELGTFQAYFEKDQVTHSDCGHDCYYFVSEMCARMAAGDTKRIDVYYRGGGMDLEEHRKLGTPEWCITADFPHATWNMREYHGTTYSVGIVIDLDELWAESATN